MQYVAVWPQLMLEVDHNWHIGFLNLKMGSLLPIICYIRNLSEQGMLGLGAWWGVSHGRAYHYEKWLYNWTNNIGNYTELELLKEHGILGFKVDSWYVLAALIVTMFSAQATVRMQIFYAFFYFYFLCHIFSLADSKYACHQYVECHWLFVSISWQEICLLMTALIGCVMLCYGLIRFAPKHYRADIQIKKKFKYRFTKCST